ncbi:hypothetical protein QQS21_010133 [Conoideocrella luteorostrata]|uniref:SANT domain-containing protein n=1 Tax=Conoideocrella luteorostrata TaxID=1105319 RepID=A0AAJ0CI07_9HYPO|nr:hypothetical protein QQS21_010133 [Conoideocrella luteorostrata]
MSSMFKKKGGLAFKPKAPVARPRPSAHTTKPTPTPTPTPTPQPAIDVPSETIPETEFETIDKQQEFREIQQNDLQNVAQDPSDKEKETPVASPRRNKRRTSLNQQPDATIRPQPQPENSSARSETIEPGPVTEPPQADPQPTTIPSTHMRTRRHSDTDPPPEPSIETSDERIPSSEKNTNSEPTEPLKGRQSATVSITINPSEEPAAAASAPKPVTKRATRKPPTPSSAENITTDTAETESPRPKKRQRKATQQQDADSLAPAPRKRKASTPNANGSRSSSRRARSATPEDAEAQVVDLQKLRMSDLTKDLRIGKKFSRHDELRDRERKARLKTKLDKESDTPSEAGDANGSSQSPAPGTIAKSSTPGTSSASAAPAASSGPQFRIVDGQIVVDQNSLVMDRHARAAAAQAGKDMETIEENDFTRLITSSSFMNTSKLKGPNIWTEQETELFYRGLRMFGTDFQMISKMFPGKQRRHVKLKYNREERHNPQRIDSIMIGEKTIKMDIDEYIAFTGTEFESVETIEAEQRKIQEDYEAERQKLADEQAELMRKKREELFADEDGEGDAKKKKKGKRKGKQTVSYGLNGEPIAQEGQ